MTSSDFILIIANYDRHYLLYDYDFFSSDNFIIMILLLILILL